MKKFRNTYRIPPARLAGWDYGQNGSYFITICTKNRKCWFGDVVEGRMILSEFGKIADQCWMDIPDHFPFVRLDVYVVMPNHIHGIVIIDKSIKYNDDDRNLNHDGNFHVETQNFASLLSIPTPIPPSRQISKYKNQFGPQSQNLASIIRGYKIGVTKNSRSIDPEFTWQSRFYDHIIRNGRAHRNISEYIVNNPQKWIDDKFNPNR